MARRAAADLEHILTLDVEREVLIERRHAVDLRLADAHLVRDVAQRVLRQVPILGLHILHDRNDLRGIAGVIRKDLVNEFVIDLFHNFDSLSNKFALCRLLPRLMQVFYVQYTGFFLRFQCPAPLF
jgi:hypothetical protein